MGSRRLRASTAECGGRGVSTGRLLELEMQIARATGYRPSYSEAEARELSDEAKALFATLRPPRPRSKRRASVRSDQTDVYRFYSSDGYLLYVGLSCSTAARMSQHRQSAFWQQVSKIEIEHFPNRDAASARERELIALAGPLYNRNTGGA